MTKDWLNLRKAINEDKPNDFLAELYLDQVPLTDHYEWTVWLQRLRPNNNYTKNFGWFHSYKEADECFGDVMKQNSAYKMAYFAHNMEHKQ